MINWKDRIEKIRKIYEDPASTAGERETAARKIVELQARWEKAKQESAKARGEEYPPKKSAPVRRTQTGSSNKHINSDLARYRGWSNYAWEYYEHHEVPTQTLVRKDGKTYVDFTNVQAKATDRQMQYVVSLCKKMGYTPPEFVLTWDSASKFIELVKYKR